MVGGTDTTVDRQVGEKPVFRVGDAEFTWNDVIAHSRETGDWATLESEVRAGLGALREAGDPSEDEVDAAARSFRYGRGLLAGDDLDAWLDSRGLSVESWHDYLRRSIARERAPEAEPGEDDPAPHVWAEGVCSGALENVARELAALAAVAPSALDEFRRAAATEAAIAREIESNRLDWVRVRYDAVLVPDADTAGEAALCVRSDGEPLATVAERIGAELFEIDAWLDELEPELAAKFLASDTGTLAGPVRVEDGYVLALLHEKTPPTAGDEEVQARAAETLAERAVTRAVDDRVTWLEPL
jgi:hypothetical protein